MHDYSIDLDESIFSPYMVRLFLVTASSIFTQQLSSSLSPVSYAMPILVGLLARRKEYAAFVNVNTFVS